MQDKMQKYKKLGLIGSNNNALLMRKDVDYPTDQINISRMLDGHQDCFVQVVPVNLVEAEKKKVIITDWSYRHDIANNAYSIEIYISDLISDGFEVYAWTGELTRINTKESLETCLRQIEPIHRQALKRKLPALRLAADECYILDVTRMNADLNFIFDMKQSNHRLTLNINDLKSAIPADELERLLNTIPDEDDVKIGIYHLNSIEQMNVVNRLLDTHRSLHIKGMRTGEYLEKNLRVENLRQLKLAGGTTGPEELTNILKQTTKLESLAVSMPSSNSNVVFDVPDLSKLKSLRCHLNILTGDQLESFLNAASNLEILHFQANSYFRMSPNLRPLPQLKQLHVDAVNYSGHESISGLDELIRRAPHLTKLHIKNQILGANIAADFTLDELEVLNIESTIITKPALNNICTKAAKLKKMKLICCNLPDDWTFPAKLTELTSLDLRGTTLFTTFKRLSLDCPKLKKLSIDKLYGGLDPQYQFVFPELEYLEINLEKSISKDQLDHLLECMPKLKIVTITYPDNRMLRIINPHTDRETQIIDSGQVTNPTNIENVLEAEKNVKSLHLKSLIFRDEFVKSTTPLMLDSLGLTESRISHQSLNSLLKRSTKLKSLNLTSSELYVESMNDVDIAFMNNSIEEMNLYHTQGRIDKLLIHTPHLKKLDLSGCTFKNIVDQPIPLKELETLTLQHTSISRRELSHLLQQTPKLKHLLLKGWHDSINRIDFLEPGSLAELETLDLSLGTISCANLYEILKRAPKLKTLILNYVDGLKDSFPAPLNLPDLEILDISNTSLDGSNFAKLISTSKKLKKLQAGKTPYLTNLPRLLVNMPDLYDANFNSSAIKLSELKDVLSKSPGLHQLNIANCRYMTDSYSSIKPSLPKLENLIADSSNISMGSILQIIKDSAALTTLDINNCKSLLRFGEKLEPVSLPRLTKIIASYSTIDTHQLAALIKYNHALVELELKGCKSLTVNDDTEIYCPDLQKLNLYEAEINSEWFSALTADSDNIEEISLYGTKIKPAKKPIQPAFLPVLKRLVADESEMESEQLAALLHEGNSLKSLSLNRCRLTGDFTHTISCGKLTSLSLDGATMSSELLGAILEQAPELTVIDLDNIVLPAGGFILPVSLPKLETLRVRSSHLTSDHLAAILSDASSLKSLQLERPLQLNEYSGGTISCPNLDRISFDVLVTDSKFVNAVLSQAQQITHINASDTKFSKDDIAPVNLPKLNTIAMKNVTITAKQLSALLVKADKLTSIQLINDSDKTKTDLTDGDIHPIYCPRVHQLKLTGFEINNRLLSGMMQSSELQDIDLTRCRLTSDQALTPGNLSKLETISINQSTFNGNHVFTLLNAAPNIIYLSLINCKQMNTNSISLMKNSLLKKLHTIALDESTLSSEQLSELLNHSPELMTLKMDSTSISRANLNLTSPLPALREAYLQGSSIHNEHLISLFKQASRLEKISLSGCGYLDFATLASTMPVMTDVTYLNLYNNPISRKVIDELIAKLPMLQSLTLDSSQLTSSEVNDLERRHPKLKISMTGLTISSRPSSSPAFARMPAFARVNSFTDIAPFRSTRSKQNTSATAAVNKPPATSLRFDSDIYYDKDNDPAITVHQVFRHKQPDYPATRDYRIEGYTDIRIGDQISFISPDMQNMSPVNVSVSAHDLSQLYEEKYAQSENMFLGEIDINADGWTPLPTLGSRDVIANIEANPDVPVEVRYCQETALYYVKPVQPQRNVHITYLLKHDAALTDFPVEDVDVSGITLSINPDGSLKTDTETMAKINAMNDDQKINFLASYLRVCGRNLVIDKNKQKRSFKNDIDAINEMLATHTGACRHTAMAFAVMAKALGIKTRIIDNDCHRFVEVMHDRRMCRLELGGWPGNVNTIPLKNPGNTTPSQPVAEPVQQSTAVTTNVVRRRPAARLRKQHAPAGYATVYSDVATPANTIAPVQQPVIAKKTRIIPIDENRFAIWNKQSSQAANATEYALELLNIASQMRPGSKNILSMIQPDKIETLHKAMIEQTRQAGQQCFYIHHLDDIRTSCYAIDNATGTYSAKDSELIRFIKQSKPGDVLMVNWSDYEAKHVGHNTMLDLNRSIQGMSIPEGVNIIGVLDKSISLGEDFYSRNRYKSNAPDALASGDIISPVKAPEKSSLTEIVFYDDQWKREILGEYKIGEQGFQFASSMLLDAITSGKPGVVLRNAPWNLQDFRLAVTTLMQQRQIFVNGEIFKIPDNFDITFDNKPLPLNIGTYQITRTESVPNNAILLNQTTLAHFFGSYQCLPHHMLAPVNGYLADHHDETLSIYVSSPLPHAAWAKLLTEANQRHVKLMIASAPGMDIPAAMLSHSTTLPAVKAAPLTSTFTTSVIAANDISLALKHLPDTAKRDAIIIPVNNLTNVSDLIERIRFEDQNGKKLFTHSTCVLADVMHSGKKIILTGTLSTLLASQLSTLFMPNPYITINGKREDIKSGQLTLISENNPIPFIKAELKNYSDADCYAELTGDTKLIALLKETCEAFYRAAPSFKHFDFNQLNIMLSRLQSLPANNPLTPFIRLHAQFDELKPLAQKIWQEHRYANKPVRKEDPISKRLRKVEAELKDSPFVFIAGSSGIGKSRFMQHDFKTLHGKPVKMYESMEKIHEWLTDADTNSQHVLFLDEANLQAPGTFDLFAGLMRKPPVINIDGTLQLVPKNKKIVFAGNFRGYKNRLDHAFFHEFGHVITFKEFPDAYLRQHVIDPVLKSCLPNVDAATLDTYAKLYLQTYHHLNQLFPDTHPVTARNLQMMALRTAYLDKTPGALPLAVYDEVSGMLNQKQRREIRYWLEDQTGQQPNIKHIKHESKQNVALHSRQFHLTKMRHNAIRQLDCLFALRETKRTTPGLATAGTSGILFEGESGIGKSLMAMEYLNEHGFTLATNDDPTPHDHHYYYHLTPTDPIKMQQILLKAFHEGAAVIIDELNSLPLEHILNPLLSGVDLDGKPAKNPGFFVIGTQNPSSFVKRQVLSSALLNRLQFVDLKEYGFDDLLAITGSINYNADVSHELTTDYKSAKLFAKQHHKSPEPTPRDLFSAAKAELEASSPLSSSAETSPELSPRVIH